MTAGTRVVRRMAAASAAGLMITMASTGAVGHPHAWIDFWTEPVVDDAGVITGLRQHWRFDVYYTLFIVESLHAEARAVEDAALMDVAQASLTNLHPFDYFTEVSQGDLEVGFETATGLETGLDGEALWMTFTVPFEQSLSPADGPIRYRVYDPEFYVEMRHIEDEPIHLSGELSECRTTIVDGEPSVEQTLFAASLDIGVAPGFNLGEVFAQTATLDCTS